MYIQDTKTPFEKVEQILEEYLAGNEKYLAGTVSPDKRKHYEKETKEIKQFINNVINNLH